MLRCGYAEMAKVSALIDSQYRPVAIVSPGSQPATRSHVLLRAAFRQSCIRVSCNAQGKPTPCLGPYVWPVSGVEDLRVAPFHLLASEGRVWFDRDHVWHMRFADSLTDAGEKVLTKTRWRLVTLADEVACAEAIAWWDEQTGQGGEGMVVKPREFFIRGPKGLVQPALKVRGREYLRIIYGAEYDAPDNLVPSRIASPANHLPSASLRSAMSALVSWRARAASARA